MSKILFGQNMPSLSTSQIRGAKINALKMEIAKVKNQEQMGLISQAEAQMKIAALESRLSEIEFAPAQEIEPPTTPQEQPPALNSDSFTQNEGSDFNQQQDSFFQQQAAYNRAFHNI